MVIALLLQASGGASSYMNLVLMGGVFIIMYFFMVRPQQQRMKKEKAFRDNLKMGDEVVTDGGICGKIEQISAEDPFIMLKIDRDVKIKVLRASIRMYASQSQEIPKS